MEFNGKPIIFCEYDDEFTLGDGYDEGNQLSLGNDGIFLVTFFIAFIFNWIGFFLSFCSTNTIAGRYGAISGFGLSLIKWILIVRFSDYFIGYFEGKIWLWWIFLAVDIFRNTSSRNTLLHCAVTLLKKQEQGLHILWDELKSSQNAFDWVPWLSKPYETKIC
ncbi:NEDD4 family-interacting protein 1-like isoform X1 [Stegostoma tigrinum]|uniref:NEDD4 family-interacting protein 1-like isoform X1 n=1 Tax=Stegostoma tigrinum TaxID=3053191 RepID=UPI002870113A|nr:NEDD4 family-interacting protein 1-like isoform X1 [Stegostoma tigrinum]